MDKQWKLQLLEMYKEYRPLNIVLTMFEIHPYDILILQDGNGELLTIKTFRNGR